MKWFVLTEKQVVPSAVVDDIDFGAVRSFMKAQGLDTEQAPQPAREHDLRNASVVDEPWSTPSSTGTTPSPALRCCWKCSTTASW